MQKIISLFQRNHEGDRLVRDEIVPGTEWVLAGEGKATRKFDGTCCLIRDGILLKRYDAKRGKVLPAGFEPAQEPDPVTGHWPGWLPVGDGHEDRWHREAFILLCMAWRDSDIQILNGTYELCGPKIQGNPENIPSHLLILHGIEIEVGSPRDFKGLKTYLQTHDIEGIVWHHPDGRMVKIKGKDFGIDRRFFLANQEGVE